MDPHFSRASPLNRRDSLFICENLIFFLFLKKKVGVATYFYLFLKGKTSKNKTPNGLLIFLEKLSAKNLSLGSGIRLLIGKVR